jgi:hypothetical protein
MTSLESEDAVALFTICGCLLMIAFHRDSGGIANSILLLVTGYIFGGKRKGRHK